MLIVESNIFSFFSINSVMAPLIAQIVFIIGLTASHPLKRPSSTVSHLEESANATCSPNSCCVGQIEGVMARACYKNGTLESLTSPKRGERLGIFGPIVLRSSSPTTNTDFASKSPPSHIKILSLNLWGLRFSMTDSDDINERVEALSQHLLEENYDVVFIQELWYNKDFQQIKNTFPYSTNYGSPHSLKCPSIPNDKRYLIQPLPVDCNGLTILSRTDIKDTSFDFFQDRVRSELAEYFARRGSLVTRTVIEGKKVSLVNTHLATWHTSQETDHSNVRVAQAEQLIEGAKAEEEWADLVIVAGDMNSTPESPVMAKFGEAGFKDVVEGKEKFDTWGHPENTYTGHEKGVRIDYILYKGIRGTYEVTSTNRLEFKADIDGQKKSVSDHEGIECLIKLS